MKMAEVDRGGPKTFTARVKLPNQATVISTQVVASNYELARRLLIAQYGKGSVISAITEVK